MIRPLLVAVLSGPVLLGVRGGAGLGQEETAPLTAAFAEAEAQGALRVSYTMTFTAPGAPAVTSRYDAVAEEWTLLSGDPEALPDDARRRLHNVRKSESEPGGLLYADFPAYIGEPALLAETDAQAVYAFVPSQVGEEDVAASPDGGPPPVIARLIIDKRSGHLARYEVRALKPFKPNAVTALKAFKVVQEFERLGERGPALLRRLVSKQKGKRLFRTLDTDFEATFSDFTIIE